MLTKQARTNPALIIFAIIIFIFFSPDIKPCSS